jgi:hypothetical protein
VAVAALVPVLVVCLPSSPKIITARTNSPITIFQHQSTRKKGGRGRHVGRLRPRGRQRPLVEDAVNPATSSETTASSDATKGTTKHLIATKNFLMISDNYVDIGGFL